MRHAPGVQLEDRRCEETTFCTARVTKSIEAINGTKRLLVSGSWRWKSSRDRAVMDLDGRPWPVASSAERGTPKVELGSFCRILNMPSSSDSTYAQPY